MSKILFIYEGKNSERKFCKLIIDKYFPTKRKHKEYVSFRTNIYALYDELRKDDGLDIVFLVTEKAKKRGSIIKKLIFQRLKKWLNFLIMKLQWEKFI